MQKISGCVRRAVDDYNMIEDGDKIAVALSGGKDSIALLYKMRELQYFYRNKFELVAITINPGFPEFDEDLLHNLCENVGVPLVIYKSNIKEIDLSGWTFQSPISLEYLTQNCLNLEYVKLPEMQMLNIDKAFEGCEKLKKVILPINKVKDSKTPEKLFFNCKNLRLVDLSIAQLSNFLTNKETLLTFDNLTNVPNNCVIVV